MNKLVTVRKDFLRCKMKQTAELPATPSRNMRLYDVHSKIFNHGRYCSGDVLHVSLVFVVSNAVLLTVVSFHILRRCSNVVSLFPTVSHPAGLHKTKQIAENCFEQIYHLKIISVCENTLQISVYKQLPIEML